MAISRWRERWRAQWFAVGPRRAVSEALFVQVPILVWMALIGSGYATKDIVRFGAPALVMSAPICILYGAFRIRQSAAPWWRDALLHALIGLMLAIAPAVTLTIMWQTHSNLPHASPISTSLLLTAWLAAFTGAYGLSRIGAVALRVWDHMRRTRLVWSLTNAHLLIVVFGFGLVSLLIIAAAIFRREVPLQLLPILFVIFLLAVVAVLVVLPPSALFSYFFASRTTRRLEALASAAASLRQGDYSRRVQVTGEDEVAQLQADFNAMAEDLERTVRELEAERDRVAQLLHAQRELVASVSHELRTPVATLRGYLESARAHWQDEPPPTLRHDLAIMEREALHLQRLISDLFTLSRAEVKQLSIQIEPTDIVSVARRCVEAVAPLAQAGSHIEVVLQAPDHPLVADVDASRLEQVLGNLLQNAVRHTPPGGIVAVEVAVENGTVALHVRDTGEGIAADDLPYIWERFFRVEKSRARQTGGTGIGLALVKELTEAMGGWVAAQSMPGEGSCFTVRFPLVMTLSAQKTILSDAARQA